MIVQSLEQGMSRNVAATLVPAACVKLADTKKQPAGRTIHCLSHVLNVAAVDLLNALIEAGGQQFVFSRLYQAAAGHTNPKVISETLAFMSSAVQVPLCQYSVVVLIESLLGVRHWQSACG